MLLGKIEFVFTLYALKEIGGFSWYKSAQVFIYRYLMYCYAQLAQSGDNVRETTPNVMLTMNIY